jgi:hypothetical protein
MKKILLALVTTIAMNGAYAGQCTLGTWCQLNTNGGDAIYSVSAAQGNVYSCTLLAGQGDKNEFVSAVLEGTKGFNFGPTTISIGAGSFINGMVGGGFDASNKGSIVIHRNDGFKLPATILCGRLGFK